MTDLLNRADEAGFTPMLSQSDALVQSITVQSIEKPGRNEQDEKVIFC